MVTFCIGINSYTRMIIILFDTTSASKMITIYTADFLYFHSSFSINREHTYHCSTIFFSFARLQQTIVKIKTRKLKSREKGGKRNSMNLMDGMMSHPDHKSYTWVQCAMRMTMTIIGNSIPCFHYDLKLQRLVGNSTIEML